MLKIHYKKNDIQLQIQNIYIKDVSFEIPQGANIFNKEWNPDLKVELNTEVNDLPEENTYEVTLTVAVNVKSDENEAFKVEIQQSGIFIMVNMEDEQLHHTYYVVCPNILYHYAREAISDLVLKGGFPQLYLENINFNFIYQRK